MSYHHISVMPNEVLAYLDPKPGRLYVDCTVGGTGHSGRIVREILPDGLLIGIDRDSDALGNAETVLKPFLTNIRLFHDNFIRLPAILEKLQIESVDGILLDLGLSFNQIENSGRGFSFGKDEFLDMRMDARSGITAYDIVNDMDEKKLSDIFFRYGEERFSRRIAERIVLSRKKNTIRTSRELATIVAGAIPYAHSKKQKIHPATRVFMALRIAVNNELENLETFLGNVAELLKPGGRLLVISFHSLEDRIVKHWIRNLESPCVCPPQFPECVCGKKPVVRAVTRKAVLPDQREIDLNPMARSARLRVAEKLASVS